MVIMSEEQEKQEINEMRNEMDEIIINDLSVAAGLPRSYDNCKCPCHYTPGMMHVVACCHPSIDTKITGTYIVEEVQYNGNNYYAIKTENSIYMQRRGLKSGSDQQLSNEEEVIVSLCEFILNNKRK